MRMIGIVLIVLLAAQGTANAQSTPVPIPTGPSASSQPGQPPPVPHVSFDGPALTFDFPEVQIGVAEYEEGRTSATTWWSSTGSMLRVVIR